MKLSLRSKATLLTAALVVGLLATVGVAVDREIESGRLEALQAQQDAAAASIAAQLGAGLERHVARLETAAARIGTSSADDPARLRRALRDLSAAAAGFDTVRYLPAPLDAPEQKPARSTPARTAPAAAAGHPERTTISPPATAGAGRGAEVVVSAPVLDRDGRLLGRLAGTLNLERAELARPIAAAAVDRPSTDRIEVATIGNAPVVVIHPDRARVLSRAERFEPGPAGDGVRMNARSAVRGIDWEVRTTTSIEAALAAIASARRRLWTLLGALALIASGFGAWAVRRLLLPLETLRATLRDARETSDAARAIGSTPASESSTAVDTDTGDERTALAREFVALHADLQTHRSELAALRTASPLALQRQAATLRSITEAIPAIVVVVDAEGRYRFVNSAFERWYGTPRERIIGATLQQVLGPLEYEKTRAWSDRALAGETVHFERRYQHADGIQNLAIDYIPLRLDNGETDGFVGVSQDITQHRQEQGRLRQLAQRDGLTGLLNRAGFEEHLERCLDAGEGDDLALLYIDLDHFKPVNDQFGHPVGDRVLQDFAARLRDAVRPTDVSARLGGDEFAVVLKGVRELANANRVADKIVAAARAPFEVDGRTLHIGASVGVAFGVKPGAGWRELVSHADTLLYEAKKAGRGQRASALH